MKNSTWDNFIKPIVVLFTICLVVSGALAFTNGITAPIIERNAALAADAARIELLPTATDGFEKMDVEMDGVQEMYRAKNGTGYTVTSAAKGYGGDVKWMVAFDTEGTIVGAKVLEQSETAGLGAKVEEAWFQEQFVGKTEELTTSNFDMISGATISSKATMNALNIARKAFMQYAMGVVVEEKGPEVTFVGNTYTSEADGFIGPVSVSITFNEDGSIAAAKAVGAEETPEIGGAALPKLCEALVTAGSADIDTVSGATFTSDGFINAAKAVIDAYKNGTAIAGEATEEVVEDTLPDEPAEEPEVVEETVEEGVVLGQAKGFSADIVAHVTFNEDGTVATVTFDLPAGDNLGGPVNESPFIDQFAGISSTEGLEAIAGATFSSEGAIAAVQAAIDANK